MRTLILKLLGAVGLEDTAWRIFSWISHSGDMFRMKYPAGHFYSPIPSAAEIEKYSSAIFAKDSKDIPGIEMNEEGQLALLEEFRANCADIHFPAIKTPGYRYYHNNDSFCLGDAIILSAMMRRFRPRKVIEIGSGCSSCVMLDTRERFLGGAVECTFIEPYPGRFHSLINKDDIGEIRVFESKIQDIAPDLFKDLDAGDFLFVDSSHVSKAASDVNFIFFSILPVIKSGVFVHFHDIFSSFEYPRTWVEGGIAWNENYLLRAFLQYNREFEVVFFNDFMQTFHREEITGVFPGYNGGGGLWLRRK